LTCLSSCSDCACKCFYMTDIFVITTIMLTSLVIPALSGDKSSLVGVTSAAGKTMGLILPSFIMA
jgi:hypothetical protein